MIRYIGTRLGTYYFYNKNPNNMAEQTWIDGFKVLLLYLFSALILIVFCIISGEWTSLLINMSLLAIMRSVNEGRHYSMDQCLILTNGLFIASTLFSKLLFLTNFHYAFMILTLIFLIVKTLKNKRWFVFLLYVCCLFSTLLTPASVILIIYITIDYSTYKKELEESGELNAND